MYSLPADKTLPPLRSLNIPYGEQTQDTEPLDRPNANNMPRSAEWLQRPSSAQSPYPISHSYSRPEYIVAHASHTPYRAYTHPQPSVSALFPTQNLEHAHFHHQHDHPQHQQLHHSPIPSDVSAQERYQQPQVLRQPSAEFDSRKPSLAVPTRANNASRQSLDISPETSSLSEDAYTDSRNSMPPPPSSAPGASYARFDYTTAPRRPASLVQDRVVNSSPSPQTPPEHWSYPPNAYPQQHQQHPNPHHATALLSTPQRPPTQPYPQPTTSNQPDQGDTHYRIPINREPPAIQPQQLLSQAYRRATIATTPTPAPNPSSSSQYPQSTVHPHQLQNARLPTAPPQRLIMDPSSQAPRPGPSDRHSSLSHALAPPPTSPLPTHTSPLAPRQGTTPNYISSQDSVMMLQSVSPYPQNADTEREAALSKIISHSTLLNDFALRYGKLQMDLPSARPSAVEIGQMNTMAHEILSLLQLIKAKDLAPEERAELDASLHDMEPSREMSRSQQPIHQHHHNPHQHQQPQPQQQQQQQYNHQTTTGDNAYPLTPAPIAEPTAEAMGEAYSPAEFGGSNAEEDMQMIRQKRLSSTTTAPAPPLTQLKGKYRKRGRSTPPGKCHSCNSRETPEWRRGPDGARTLCNACGLHYAKLTRKRDKSGGEMPPIDIEMLRASARAADPSAPDKPIRKVAGPKQQLQHHPYHHHHLHSRSSMDVTMTIAEEERTVTSPGDDGFLQSQFHIITVDPSPKKGKDGRTGSSGDGGSGGNCEQDIHPSVSPTTTTMSATTVVADQIPIQWNHQFAISNARGFS